MGKEYIEVFGRDFDLDVRGDIGDWSFGRVSSDDISRELNNISRLIGKSLDSLSENIRNYELDEVSIVLEVSSSGKFALLGSGITAGGKGGLTLKFKKSQ